MRRSRRSTLPAFPKARLTLDRLERREAPSESLSALGGVANLGSLAAAYAASPDELAPAFGRPLTDDSAVPASAVDLSWLAAAPEPPAGRGELVAMWRDESAPPSGGASAWDPWVGDEGAVGYGAPVYASAFDDGSNKTGGGTPPGERAAETNSSPGGAPADPGANAARGAAVTGNPASPGKLASTPSQGPNPPPAAPPVVGPGGAADGGVAYLLTVPANSSYVVDVNKGVVLSEAVVNHDFSTWAVDLRSQVSGATVTAYSWDFSGAPEASGVAGSSSANVTFSWSSFTGAAKSETIDLTTTFGASGFQTQTFHFQVAATDSPAYASAPAGPGASSTVVPPDHLQAGAAMQPGPHHAVGLADGALFTAVGLPAYNPTIAPLNFVYNSLAADAQPIFLTRYQLDPAQAVPGTVDVRLTVNGTPLTTYVYDTSALNPGDYVQMALQDSTGQPTGRYTYSVTVKANYGSPATSTYNGSFNVVNDGSSPFGAGWWLAGLDRIVSATGGVMLVSAGGTSLWFSGSGTYTSPAGDFSTLVDSAGSTYTRTFVDGTVEKFNSSGQMTSFVDRNSNTTTYTYSSGKLSTVTDPNNQVSTFVYDGSSKLSTVTDPAGRVTTFTVSSGDLTAVTDPSAGAWAYAYTSKRLTNITDPVSKVTTVSYDANTHRVSGVAEADGATESFAPLQSRGFQAGGTPAATLTAAATADVTDGNAQTWSTRLDWRGFGQTNQATDPLGNVAVQYTDANGLVWLDSNANGNRTDYHYDGDGNPTRVTYADDTHDDYTYNGFSEVLTHTDPLSKTTTFTYDGAGNLTTATDPLNQTTTYAYDAKGNLTRSIAPQTFTAHGEFRAGTATTAIQLHSGVAADADGDYVVAWSSYGQWGIFAQRYDATGSTVGSQFQVNSTAGTIFNIPSLSAVAMDADGDFVVVWTSYNTDGSDWGVYARLYTADGNPTGNQFQVNTYTTGYQIEPSVAMDADGDFVIAWQSNGQDGDSYGVYAQRYNSAGTTQGGEFRVSTTTTGSQALAAVALDATGDFVIAWSGNGSGDSGGVFAQRYNSSGTAQGGEFLVNTTTTSGQGAPALSLDPAGDFVIAWSGYGASDGAGVYAQRYNASGVAQGGEFRVNTYTTDTQQRPAVALDAAGDFVVAWMSYQQDGDEWGVYAQRYNAAGTAAGAEFRVNEFTGDTQQFPSATMGGFGDSIISWESKGQSGTFAIYARRLNVTATTMYAYDASQRLTSATDGNGARTTFTYDTAGNVQTVTDANSQTTTFGHDRMGRTTGATAAWSDGATQLQGDFESPDLGSGTNAYQYSPPGAWTTGSLVLTGLSGNGSLFTSGNPNAPQGDQVAVIQKNGTFSRTVSLPAGTYNLTFQGAQRNATPGPQAHDQTVSVLVDGNNYGNLTPSGTSYQLQTSSNFTVTAGPHTITFAGASAAGDYTAFIDDVQLHVVSGGTTTTTTTTYDAMGQVLTSVDAFGNTTAFTYDNNGRLKAVTDPLSHTTTYTYDAAGNLETVTDGNGHTSTYTYDSASRRLTATDALSHTTSYDYYPTGSLKTVTDPLSHTTTYTYDSQERLQTVTDPLNHITTYAYDAAGRLATVTDANAKVTSYAYDNFGRQVAVTDPLGHVTTTAYDSAGNVQSVTDALNHTTTYAYDALHQLTSVTDANGNTTSFTYDVNGNQTTVTDALGNTTTSVYDIHNRPISVTDALGHVNLRTYDLNGRLVNTIDPDGNKTGYSYDAAGNLKTVTDPSNNTTTYGYDAANLRTTTTDPNTKVTTFVFDAADRLTSTTDRAGRVTSYAYDNANRLTNEYWRATAGGGVTNSVTYTYDNDDRLTDTADGNSANHYTYDSADNLLTASTLGSPGGMPAVTLTYAIAANNLRNSVSDNLNGQTTYTYDAADRLTHLKLSVSGTAGPQVTLAYDVGNRLTSVLRQNSTSGPTVTTTYTYDVADRLTNIAHHSSSAGALASFTYAYDVANRLTRSTTNAPDGTRTMTYDAAGQLTAVDSSNNAFDESFAFDGTGNRNSAGYVTAAGNRMTGDGTYTYTYDAAGNLTQRTETSNSHVEDYVYDNRNRLLTLTDRDSAGGAATYAATYTYDVQDRRIGVKVDADGAGAGAAVQTWTVYDGGNAYADFDSGGSLTMRYLNGFGLDERYARQTSGGSEAWYLTDNINSVRQVVQTDGTVVYAADYSAFGKLLNTSGAGGDRFTYTGRERDAGTGLYYYRARYYGAGIGRFTSEDPLGFAAGDSNLYRYVGNGPAGRTDPTGLVTWWNPITWTANEWGAFGGSLKDSYDSITDGLAGAYLTYAPRALGGDEAAGQQLLNQAYDKGPFGQTEHADPVIKYGTWGAIGLATLATAAAVAVGAYEFLFNGNESINVSDLYKFLFGNCFPTDTPVATERGLRPIGSVEAGQKVWAFDFREGIWRLAAVERRHDSRFKGPMVTIDVGTMQVTATAYHPFWVIEGEDLEGRSALRHVDVSEDRGGALTGRWVNSHDLRAGDVVYLRQGGPATIQRIEQRLAALPVCNLTISGLHTFAVGEAQFLVHNTSGTEGVPNYEWGGEDTELEPGPNDPTELDPNSGPTGPGGQPWGPGGPALGPNDPMPPPPPGFRWIFMGGKWILAPG